VGEKKEGLGLFSYVQVMELALSIVNQEKGKFRTTDLVNTTIFTGKKARWGKGKALPMSYPRGGWEE